MQPIARSPTIEIIKNDGFEQYCIVFADAQIKTSPIDISQIKFKKMKPYKGIQISMLNK